MRIVPDGRAARLQVQCPRSGVAGSAAQPHDIDTDRRRRDVDAGQAARRMASGSPVSIRARHVQFPSFSPRQDEHQQSGPVEIGRDVDRVGRRQRRLDPRPLPAGRRVRQSDHGDGSLRLRRLNHVRRRHGPRLARISHLARQATLRCR